MGYARRDGKRRSRDTALSNAPRRIAAAFVLALLALPAQADNHAAEAADYRAGDAMDDAIALHRAAAEAILAANPRDADIADDFARRAERAESDIESLRRITESLARDAAAPGP